jgi:hypothetical protein
VAHAAVGVEAGEGDALGGHRAARLEDPRGDAHYVGGRLDRHDQLERERVLTDAGERRQGLGDVARGAHRGEHELAAHARAVDPALADQLRAVALRLLRRVQPADQRGQRDHLAPAILGVEPFFDAREHGRRGEREIVQYLGRR